MAEEIKTELSVEQQKRVDLLNEYEDLTKPDRDVRNESIDGFEADWKERWVGLQGQIDQARANRAAELEKSGVPVDSHASILAKESALMLEQYEADKDVAARQLEGGLVTPKRWVDFLKEKANEVPEDPTLTSLIEEAEKSPDAGIQGLGGTPAKAVTLSDLSHSVDKDGVINYKRGMFTVIRDVGTRLDVKKTDDRDIEAALKIAAQKFDMEKGLMLTGDAAFKARTAEIAGRLGLPLQNAEPEVMMAWKRGAALNQNLARAVIPSVDRGITGDLATPRPLMELQGPVLLRADPLTVESAAMLGVTPDGDGVVSMSAERVLKANSLIRETPLNNIRSLAKADLSLTDGGLAEDDKARLKEYDLLDDEGNLTPEAKDVVIVRDDRVMRTREQMGDAVDQAFGKYQTSGEHVREKHHQHVELKQESELVKERHEREHQEYGPFEKAREEIADNVADMAIDKAQQDQRQQQDIKPMTRPTQRVIPNEVELGR